MKKYIVIGAGILGASAAYHLAKSGNRVILADRNEKGQATAAAAGIVCPWVSQRRNKDWYRLAKAGARYYPELVKELEERGESDTGYSRVGALILHKETNKLEKAEERTLKRREEAPEIGEVTLLTREQTTEAFPPVDKEFEAVQVSGAARVDGRALRDSLIRAAEKEGAVFLEKDASLIYEGNRVTGILAGQEQWEADAVIVCAGAWAAEIFKPLGIEMDVSYQKAQIAHLKLPDEATDSWPVLMPPGDQYLLAFTGGRIVAGATHENDVSGFDARITAGGMQEVLSKALSTAPGLADASLIEARVGFRPFTPGFLPVIGAVPGWEGLLTANGLGASGLTMGPFLGQQLAKLALGHDTDIDLNPYHVQGALKDQKSE
ncbi:MULTISPECIES: NAD(P)/FAD-dependent oxidoreductase [Bacillus]|uniref:Oxidoreductase n=2 Tax=Bacillus infantis TaxID=324767 RepID=U5L6G6_9BACI|nr:MULTISPECIES: FAD-binding oxidoreductase [Bacillus]AGX02341.1 oxidoreductase [Bacillus infantis NRRL B-14911]TYS62342.1 FAD-binding oxidoreductase [Bacillus infantis]